MEENNNEMSPLGKVLLLLGGAVVLGTILSIDDEPEKSTRETSQGSKRKEKGGYLFDKYTNIDLSETKVSKEKKSNVKYLKIVTSQPNTATKKKNLGGTITGSIEQVKKYPDHYYTLTKAQQYKFRKKEQSKLSNYIAINDNANFD